MTKLEEFEENVAKAKRDLAVAEALSSEYGKKLAMAREEVHQADRRLDEARISLEEAVTEQYQAIHGKPVSFDDRYEFEKRWDARIEDERKYREEREAACKTEKEAVDVLTVSTNPGV
ncbi:hypothetical protein PP914_gp096 [Arthrobacter phage Qui]|uniref:Uncharacterized protein n=1 Tax=Arthrobacter phage Qui TaxID=2603260 RepID=A0A5B8WK41_9CAUD|nr:hypothetical protein PP914_gp096 [Arthrobacter phage Qui]QED11586.1 hypothetical protein SEA_QUI_96 [Arthrobacter phage Qui]QOC56418.1 hypothetical protein SEA_PAELLA_96 [Arthrobacter phage Paella]